MAETSPAPSRRDAAPDQARAMIVAAALPLVIEYGASVSTAKIARAAGIGEGTIFRAFADKDALLAACITEAVRPDDTLVYLESIALDQPLAARLTEAAEVMRGYITRVIAVTGVLTSAGGPERSAPANPAKDGPFPDPGTALAALFGPDQDSLRLAPERLADAFQMLLMSAGRPGAPDPLTTEELVDLFLNGALTIPGEAR
ncbi:TetR/AcrR family transcriptional regulator [Streptomyces sp. B8F3]|uniref:TetR/AcrR family transcriptional regulator n=1 Tax=unclassified Streptomyces TaxID=2593676 RepID=UPI00325E520D